ncbi:MAG TPA: DUF4388 domain-containing protein [Frankiaceae bacterium]|nr:DUF4388 domain-containing protein [Frankiaceae bacterium]
MLKGDLSATPLSDVLLALAEQAATGCLHIDDEAGDEALVYFKNGLVYAAYVPGRRPQLGARLISSGALAPEALAEALEAQETELQGWRLGELLVHLGYVERPVVEAFVTEQLREAAFDLSRWLTGRFRFRKNEKTREDVGSHQAVPDLLAEVTRRRSEWENIAGVVHGPGAVPVLSAGGLASAEMTLDQDQWALLCKVDGERSIAQLARDCGFTTFEAGQIVYALVGAGLLDVEETLVEEDPAEIDADFAPLGAALASVFGSSEEEAPAEGDSTLARISSALVVPFNEGGDWPAGEDEAPESEISRLLATPEPEAEPVAEAEPEPVVEAEVVEAEPVVEEPAAEEAPTEEAPTEDPLPRNDFRDDLASLNAAIADLPSLGLGASLEPEFPTMPEPVAEAEPEAEPVEEPPAVAAVPEDPFGDSLARVSEALSALLGDALPTVAMPEPPKAVEPTPEEIAAAREEEERLERSRAAAAAELAEAHAMAEAARHQRFGSRLRRQKTPDDAARKEAERLAAEEAERVEAERAEAERVEAERAEAERVEAERAETERIEAERAETERIEAERAEAERIEAERAEAERAEAERVAAEETARQEAEREAAERAAADAAEAERVEAERVAAEEAAREEAERVEAERLAAEEAAREEADRVAAEEARLEIERLAAEEAARQEAERVAAEETERLAAEEAAREAAEREEAERALAEAAEPDPEPEPVNAFEVTALLRDLNDSPAIDTVETVEEYVPDEYVPEGRPMTPADPEPAYANGSRAGLSETAALLRELTSLGLDDEPAPSAPASTPPPARSAPPAKDQPKKRKGLFGRG